VAAHNLFNPKRRARERRAALLAGKTTLAQKQIFQQKAVKLSSFKKSLAPDRCIQNSIGISVRAPTPSLASLKKIRRYYPRTKPVFSSEPSHVNGSGVCQAEMTKRIALVINAEKQAEEQFKLHYPIQASPKIRRVQLIKAQKILWVLWMKIVSLTPLCCKFLLTSPPTFYFHFLGRT
jgi:hypothetical protein